MNYAFDGDRQSNFSHEKGLAAIQTFAEGNNACVEIELDEQSGPN